MNQGIQCDERPLSIGELVESQLVPFAALVEYDHEGTCFLADFFQPDSAIAVNNLL